MATATITVALTGLSGAETGEVFSKLSGAAAVSQGTRVGNGNLTTNALTVGIAYALWSQGKTSGGLYGVASNTIFVVPGSSANANSRLSAWLDEIRNLFVNSTNLLAWIQTVDGGETTSGHVFLGYDPRTVGKVEQTKGPTVFIWAENFVAENVLSAKTYQDSFDIVAEIVWYQNPRASATFLEQINYLSDLLDEFKSVGTNLDSTHLGEVYIIQAPDLILENPKERTERRSQIRFSVRSGTAG